MADVDDVTRERAADELVAARADNARLRRLLDEAGLHDGLRHAFRDTVALLRAILRRTAETAQDVASYAAHLEGRLDAIARVRSRADAFGEVSLHSLVADELAVHIAYESERASLAGPRVQLRPKAAQVFALAVHELACNAVEHGPLGGADGDVSVMWRVDPGGGATGRAPDLVLMWRETGLTAPVVPARRGFGTTVLEEMLAHDLAAHTALSYGPEGLSCLIRVPLARSVGRIDREDADAPQPDR